MHFALTALLLRFPLFSLTSPPNSALVCPPQGEVTAKSQFSLFLIPKSQLAELHDRGICAPCLRVGRCRRSVRALEGVLETCGSERPLCTARHWGQTFSGPRRPVWAGSPDLKTEKYPGPQADEPVLAAFAPPTLGNPFCASSGPPAATPCFSCS